MTVLAIAWHGYYTALLAVAGLIGVIGAAVAYLTAWGRSIYDLARRLWHRHQAKAHDHEHPEEPTAEQVRVLNAVYQYFLEHGKPAPFWTIDKLLDREGMRLREQLESLPRGLLTPDISRRGGFFRSDDELMVTVEGLRYCDGGMATLDLLARALGFMAKLEKAYIPTPSQNHPVVRAADVKMALGLSPVELERVRFLFHEFELHMWTGATVGVNGEWDVTLNSENIRRFRGVNDGADYLLARGGTQSFAHRLDEEEARRPRFTLVGNEVIAAPFGSGPICLRVENEGPTDEFEATVIAVEGATKAMPPWYVRWRGSQDRRQEILPGAYWMLELCEATVASETDSDHSGGGTPGWRFLRPDGEAFVVPDGLDLREPFPGAVMRITIKVTPGSRLEWALESTATLMLSGRTAGVRWDHPRVPTARFVAQLE
jgi:hypothetical protein